MAGGGAFGGAVARSFGGSRTAVQPNRRAAEHLLPETQAAIEAAEAAGGILLRRLNRANRVRFKGSKDPVTAADVAAERCIRTMLARRFPQIGFLGEEGGSVVGADGRWIVDPLDGTIAYITGLPLFSVCIALERRGRIEVGVLCLPSSGELFVAERGRGAFLNGRRLHVSRTTRLRDAVIALWHDDTVWGNRRLRERIAALALQVRSVRIFGAGFSLACVAAGRLDAYWEQSAKPWDIAAGALLVQEAGGRVTAGTGHPFDVERNTILASNGRIHRRLVGLLNGRPTGGSRPAVRPSSQTAEPPNRRTVLSRRR
ncbi:MAG TPA: inositol monophosphatase family protein [Candidatus Methylomirabilis sp.]|nr:inositol monophosphatase family protein [Candidatus Methylomirabilis sp.]